MIRGLLWLPLLILFIGLAGAGWNEYQKVEAYRRWAEQFDRAKYDILAVLGQKGNLITWGKPTRREPTDLQTFSLTEVTDIRLLVNGEPVVMDSPPNRGKAALEFIFAQEANSIQIPFTEIGLAAQWGKILQQAQQTARSQAT